jgi:hypothetical protein
MSEEEIEDHSVILANAIETEVERQLATKQLKE